jgi:sulfite reductase alpha subunit-like flavoprotein
MFDRNSKRMPDDVRDAIVEIVMSHGAKSKEDAVEYVACMVREKRLQMETW